MSCFLYCYYITKHAYWDCTYFFLSIQIRAVFVIFDFFLKKDKNSNDGNPTAVPRLTGTYIPSIIFIHPSNN
ncbi:hypothetical protein [Niallia nealsonii]|uniref:Uncharacterized protein n=1 Tax=Niallia nealsonii TaxID=115979 RepID=A0A2N0Z777_9BACI|nr:hypothetical protein [Niallia nealsonii]PKG25361.1 hypothetical protein CWS01_02460 [Niallia nealsonii]